MMVTLSVVEGPYVTYPKYWFIRLTHSLTQSQLQTHYSQLKYNCFCAYYNLCALCDFLYSLCG